jgi:hypothetical protein
LVTVTDGEGRTVDFKNAVLINPDPRVSRLHLRISYEES